MATVFPDLTGESSCTFDNTGGTPVDITLSDTALDNLRGVDQAATDGDLANGDTVYVFVNESNTQTAVYEMTYDSTGGTLDYVSALTTVGTFTSGASISVDIELVNPAEYITRNNINELAHLTGYELEWLAATGTSAIRAKDGSAVIDGVLYQDTGNITTLTGDTTWTADSLYNVYLYDDSGTRKLEIDRRATASDDPEFDNTLDYWKAPNTTQFTSHSSGVGRAGFRLLGSIFTWNNASTANVGEFVMSGRGRQKHISYVFVSATIMRVLSQGTATTWTSIDITGNYCHAAINVDVSVFLERTTSGGAEVYAGISPIQPPTSLGYSQGNIAVRGYCSGSATFVFFGNSPMKIDSHTIYYRMGSSDSRAYIQLLGADIEI